MNDYLGNILIWPMNWAPKGWRICDGTLLPIKENQALFSLLGTSYGGDGVTTFGLPDLRGRVPLGYGEGTGITPHNIMGEKGGQEQVTLDESQLPPHSHNAIVNTSNLTCSASGIFKINATSTLGNVSIPDNNSILAQAKAGPAVANIYNNDTTVTKNVEIPGGMVNVSGTVEGTATVDIASTGSGAGVSVMEPFQVLNYIICTSGLYPARP